MKASARTPKASDRPIGRKLTIGLGFETLQRAATG
jgi:hypothetical protein